MNCARDDIEDRKSNQKVFLIFFCENWFVIIIDSFIFFIAGKTIQKFALKFLCFLNNQIQVNRREVFHINFEVREPFFMRTIFYVTALPLKKFRY